MSPSRQPRVTTRIVVLINTVDEKKFLRLKFGERRSRDVAIATNFVTRNALIVCADIYNG